MKTRNASCQMYGKGLQGEIRGVCEEAIHITVDYSILYPAAQTARLVMVPSSLEQCRVTLEVQIIHYTLVSEVAARLQLDELRNPLLTASTLRAPVFARLIMRHPHPDRVVRVGGEACAADMTLGPLCTIYQLNGSSLVHLAGTTRCKRQGAVRTREKIGIGSDIVPIRVISIGFRSKTSTPMRSPRSSNRSIPVACSSLGGSSA